jgi:aryl-alcohol dehydrogenase-like predicted oxidoreductase
VVGLALETILGGGDDGDHNDGVDSRDPSSASTTPAAAESSARSTATAIRRSDLIVNTKVGRYEADPPRQFDFTREATLASVRRSLERLRTPYVDVLQLHDPEFAPSLDVLVEQTVPAMLEAQSLGWCRRLGLTGYPMSVQRQILVRTMEAYGRNVWDQCLVYSHFNLHDTSLFYHPASARSRIFAGRGGEGEGGADSDRAEKEPQHDADERSLAACCRNRGIRITAAAPLSMGLLTRPGPPPWHPASDELKEACREAARVVGAEAEEEGHPQSGEAESADATAELALLFALSLESIPCTLLGMKSVSQVRVAQRIASRISKGLEERGTHLPSVGSDCRHDLLETILTEPERRALERVMDPAQGPFARVWQSGAYQWDGVQCARAFWKDQVGVEQDPWQDPT